MGLHDDFSTAPLFVIPLTFFAIILDQILSYFTICYSTQNLIQLQVCGDGLRSRN